MVPSLHQTVYAFLLLVTARKKEQCVTISRTQTLPPPCPDQELFTSYVLTPSPCRENKANESYIQDPITFFSVLRPGKINIHEVYIELTTDEFHDLKSLEGGTVYT